jgi:DeoR/GlpR family transcriptional regulator of sugar metabolism
MRGTAPSVAVLTTKRMELLRYVRRHNVTSVRALAKVLERGYSNVRADVQALAAGLLDTTNGGVHADCDAMETRSRFRTTNHERRRTLTLSTPQTDPPS